MQRPNKSIQVFKNPLLERLTHVHPLTPLILWGPIASWLIWRSFVLHQLSFLEVSSLGFVGLVSWTLTEYFLHRFVFHFELEGRVGQRIHFLIHGIHHSDPSDPTRLVMPPALSIALGIVLFSTFRYFLGPVWVEPFFAFFVIGYLCYDYIHFAVHHFTPRTRLGKFLKQSHMQHHFVDSSSRWGVSSPLWDYVFGTMGEVGSKKRAVF